MGKNFLLVSCILVSWTVMVSGRSAPVQSPEEAPTVDCSSLIFGDMIGCLGYLTGNINEPDKSCCDGFNNVLTTDAHCICVAIEDAPSYGFDINTTAAAALPLICGLNAPPLSNCNISTSPSTSPVTSPVKAPTPTPTSPNPPTTAPTPAIATPSPTPPTTTPTPATTPPSPTPPSTTPTPATTAPSPDAESVPAEAPSSVATPSPDAAPSGGYTICATALSTIFSVALSILFFNILA